MMTGTSNPARNFNAPGESRGLEATMPMLRKITVHLDGDKLCELSATCDDVPRPGDHMKFIGSVGNQVSPLLLVTSVCYVYHDKPDHPLDGEISEIQIIVEADD